MFLNLKLYRIGIKSSKINSLDVVCNPGQRIFLVGKLSFKRIA